MKKLITIFFFFFKILILVNVALGNSIRSNVSDVDPVEIEKALTNSYKCKITGENNGKGTIYEEVKFRSSRNLFLNTQPTNASRDHNFELENCICNADTGNCEITLSTIEKDNYLFLEMTLSLVNNDNELLTDKISFKKIFQELEKSNKLKPRNYCKVENEVFFSAIFNYLDYYADPMSGYAPGYKNPEQIVTKDYLFPLFYKTLATYGDKYPGVYPGDDGESGRDPFIFILSYFQITKVKEYISKNRNGTGPQFIKSYERCGNWNEYKCCGKDCKYYNTIEKKDIPYKWVKYSGNGEFPSDLIYMNASNGKTFAVGRANYNGGIQPGYVDVNSKVFFFSYAGKEIIHRSEYELLTGSSNNLYWKKNTEITQMDNIVIGGKENFGLELGVTKSRHENNVEYFGKFRVNNLSYNYYPFSEKEHRKYEFEVLVYLNEEKGSMHIPYSYYGWNEIMNNIQVRCNNQEEFKKITRQSWWKQYTAPKFGSCHKANKGDSGFRNYYKKSVYDELKNYFSKYQFQVCGYNKECLNNNISKGTNLPICKF